MTDAQTLAAARAAFASGDAPRALELAQSVLEYDAGNTAALSVLANAAMHLERLGEADDALRCLLQHAPDNALIARSRSRVLNRLGHRSAQQSELISAIGYWREALRLWPENDDSAFNLVAYGSSALDDDEAFALLQPLLARSPDDLGARRLLAEIERNRGQARVAADRLRPLSDALLSNSEVRALALTLGDAQLIERSLPTSTPLPDQVESVQCAFASISTQCDEGAAHALRSDLQRRHSIGAHSPSLRLALACELSLPAVHIDRDGIDAARNRFSGGLARIMDEFPESRLRLCAPHLAQLNWSNFLLAYHCENDLDLQSRYGDWLSMAAATLRPDLAVEPAQRKPGPPRIGVLSGHWNDTTAGSYFASWIEALDVAEFDTRVYALGPRFDHVTDELERRSRKFVRIDADSEGTADDQQSDAIDRAADVIRSADLDLLIYPELGMDTRLMPLAALRLARKQWVGWGHPVTSGLPTIDAYLSCADMEPADAKAHYRESLLLLPDLGTRYRLPPAPQRLARDALGLPPGKLVVVPQSLFKLHPDNDAVLLELLSREPNVRILLFATASRLEVHLVRQQLRARLGPTLFRQLHFHPMVSRSRFLEILAAADVMLDTLHWSGGNTSLDALRSGLAVATTRSRFMRGRQSAAMLHALQLDSAIAPDASGLAALAAQMLNGAARPDADRLQDYLQSPRPLLLLRALAREAVAGVV
ncbi:MAG: hypothetical protein SGI99_12135 [Pseudomonadota bacterium]|nr:hypothetical protein [Pseudomonadota bacterium]